jgi:hypothetical protein
LAVVISDFFLSRDLCWKLLEQLHSQNQEIILFHLMSPEEMDLPFEGEWIVQDAETGEELPVHMDSCRERYKEEMAGFCDQLRAHCVKLEIDYLRLRTDQALEVALIAYLEKRAAI